MGHWHALLKRQLKQFFGKEEPSAEMRAFVDAVDRAYRASDEDRKLVERSLELSSAELLQANTDMRVFFDAFPDIFLRVNEDGTILDYRGRIEHILSREELVGQRIQDTFGSVAVSEFEQALSEVRKNNRMMRVDYHVPTLSEEQFYEARFLPLGASQMVVVIRDVTELKKLQASLIQSQKLDTVGTLAGGIAHDLNNQLTPLVGYLSLLLQMVAPGDEKRQFLEEAEMAANRCKEVVQRLLNFSRPSTQRKKIISYSLILEELQKFLPKMLASIQFRISYPPDLCPIFGNETDLETVFMNLAVNARDAMSQGGVFSIEVQNVKLAADMVRKGFEPGQYILATIKDTGAGMSLETVQRIFEPFFTTKERGRGTGLGLTMVFNIVRDHGGWIEVTSEVGRGTAFEIFLPAAMTGNKPSNGNVSGTGLPRGDETILLVDDEEPIRKHGKVLLEQLGYKVIQASDGEDAVSVFLENQKEIGAVILDVMMPKLTGDQAMLQILKADPRAKIILSSGYSEGSSAEYLKKGARDFIQKPYTALDLAQSVRKCLDQ